jgi:hypothetical protein
MKSFVSTIVLFAAAGAVSAQQSPTAVTAPEAKARVVAELAAAQVNSAVKNNPFSAEEVNESVQTLADGNRIVRSSTGKFYRNSAGRVRREMNGGTGGMLGTTFSFGQGVSIVSPDLGSKYLLDSKLQTARIFEMAAGQGLSIATTAPSQAAAADLRVKLAERQAIELRSNGEGNLTPPAPPIAPTVAVAPMPALAVGGGGFAYTVSGQNSKYESRTEELGMRDFEGVQAEGTRKTTTIPAGAIGNERPIEIVYERWFSKELGVVVYSKNTDPRFGEQTYKLTNLVRAEPDPSLFSIPTHYKTLPEPGTVYKMAPARTAKSPATAPAKAVNVSAKAGRP